MTSSTQKSFAGSNPIEGRLFPAEAQAQAQAIKSRLQSMEMDEHGTVMQQLLFLAHMAKKPSKWRKSCRVRTEGKRKCKKVKRFTFDTEAYHSHDRKGKVTSKKVAKNKHDKHVAALKHMACLHKQVAALKAQLATAKAPSQFIDLTKPSYFGGAIR